MEISSVRCLVSRSGEMLGMYSLDLAFVNGSPHAVFEWAQGAEGDGGEDSEPTPTYSAPLDSRFLEKLPAGGEVAYQYRMSVEDPRPIE